MVRGFGFTPVTVDGNALQLFYALQLSDDYDLRLSCDYALRLSYALLAGFRVDTCDGGGERSASSWKGSAADPGSV